MARPRLNPRGALGLVVLVVGAVLSALYWLAQPSQDTEAAARRSTASPSDEDTGDEPTQQGAGLGEQTEDYLRGLDNAAIGGV